MGPIELYSKLR